MQKCVHMGKRLLASVIVLVMTLNTVAECLAVPAVPKEAVETQKVTLGELFAAACNGKLTAAERNILSSGMLKDTISYTVPTDGDNLVTVDSGLCKLNVKLGITEDSGVVWTAHNARISYTEDGTVKEEKVSLDETGEGTFTYDGNDYTAKVDYTAVAMIGGSAQRQMAKIPRMLVIGRVGMKEIAEQSYVADLLGANIDSLVAMADKGVPMPGGGTASIDEFSKASIEELRRQVTENTSGALDIIDKVSEYESASNKTQYLVEGGTLFRKVTEDYCDTVGMLVDADVNQSCLLSTVTTVLGIFGGMLTPEQKSQLETAKKALELLRNSRASIMRGLAEPWRILEENVIKADMTSEEFLKLDMMVEAASERDVSGNYTELTPEELIESYDWEANEKMHLLTTTVAAQVNRFDVTVQVQAQVIPLESRNSDTLKTRVYADKLVLTLTSGAAKADVEAEIEAAMVSPNSVEESALQQWSAFDVCTAYYERALVPENDYTKLEEDMVYTVTYTPRRYTLNIDDGSSGRQVPYGYNVELPAYDNQLGESKAYQYALGGALYEQGTVYRVRGDTVFTRTEDKPRVRLSYGNLAIDTAQVIEPEVQALLTSSALRLNQNHISIRVPDETDKIVSIGHTGDVYTVTARAYASRYKASLDGEELLWLPVKATTAAGEDLLLTSADGDAFVGTSIAAIDGVEVVYRLTLEDAVAGLDTEAIRIAVNLPNKLTTDAKAHLNAMAVLGEQKNRLGQIRSAQLKALKNDDSLPKFVRTALGKVSENCFDESYLKLYTYILQLESLDETERLAFFYVKDRYKMIKEQAVLLYEQLDIALGGSDPVKQEEAKEAIMNVLADLGAEGTDYTAIERVRDSMAIVAESLPDAIDPQIDTTRDMQALAGCIIAAADKTTVYTTDMELAAVTAIVEERPEEVIAVRTTEGRRIYNGTSFAEAVRIATATDGSVLILNGKAVMSSDIVVSGTLRITGVGNLATETSRFLIANGGRLMVDASIDEKVFLSDADNCKLRVVEAEDGTITYIADKVEQKEPLSLGTVVPGDAMVIVEKEDNIVKTIAAKDGKYSFDGLDPGYYVITFKKDGYVPYMMERYYFSGEGLLPSVRMVKCGDVNGTTTALGEVDVTDLACLFEWLSTGEYSGGIGAKNYMLAVADVNGDGCVNILDYQQLYMMLQE